MTERWISVGELVSAWFEAFCELYDAELAAVATASVVNELLWAARPIAEATEGRSGTNHPGRPLGRHPPVVPLAG